MTAALYEEKSSLMLYFVSALDHLMNIELVYAELVCCVQYISFILLFSILGRSCVGFASTNTLLTFTESITGLLQLDHTKDVTESMP